MEVKISAVIIACNEEKYIERCIESVKDAVDEVVVVDSYSTDRTEEICHRHDVVFIQHAFRGQIEQKNFAIAQATFPYILSLDADEYLSETLIESINEVKKDWNYDAYYFRRLTNYCGKWIRHTSWYPSPILRLWDSSLGKWEGLNPHSTFLLKSGASKKFLKGDLLHYSFANLSEHVEQIDTYSTTAAQSLFQCGKKSRLIDITVRPLWSFVKDFFLRLGFLDGHFGLLVSVNSAHTIFVSYVKLRILHKEHKEGQKQTMCFFNSTPAWGGGEKWHFEFSSSLSQKGHPVIVFTNTSGELRRRVIRSGIPAIGIRVHKLSFLNPLKILRIASILKREGVRLIIMNLSADMKVAGMAAKLAGVKRIIYRRGSAIPIRNSFINRFLFRKVLDEVLANSYETKRTILANNPRLIDPSKIRVIYNGMRFDQFDSNVNIPCYESLEGEVVIGNAGRLVRQKAQEYLVDLAVELKKRKKNVKILIAGYGRLEAQLREYARSSGVEDRIVFLGFVDDMKSFLDSIDIFVLTSLWEGFGYVIVEAMANSRPVVAFDVSSNPEIIEDGKNGYLIPPYDIGLLTDRVVQLVENRRLSKQLGAYAKDSVYKRFNYDLALRKVEEFLMEDKAS
jgi:glycosyltransferase involved in cell wall biosynthesis